MNKKKIWKRVLLLGLAVVMLALTLVSCKGEDELDRKWEANDENAVIYFSRILSTQHTVTEEAFEILVAASRGYDMTAEDFDDSKIEIGAVKDEVNMDGVKAALKKIKPDDDKSIEMYEQFIAELEESPDQVHEIVERVKAKREADLKKTSGLAVILVWIGTFLKWMTALTRGNYVLGLFFFALVVELVMLPFGIKQQRNSQRQAKLRPKEAAIRKKYNGRNDQVTLAKQREEIARLYQEEGASPMAGCLPMLIQFPIVIALYQIVIDPLRYMLNLPTGLSAVLAKFAGTSRAAGGLGMALSSAQQRGSIALLSQISKDNFAHLHDFAFYNNAGECATMLEEAATPNFNLFGVNMGLTPGFHTPYLLLLIPVLTFVAYFFSMKLTRKFSFQPTMQVDQQTGCSNAMMDIMMPAMSVYITFITPAAIGIYWIFKCILSTLKQFVLHKTMPMPVFTEEDYKAAERAMKGKKPPKAPAGSRTTSDGRVIRSLHHIDDEDDLPPRGSTPVGRYDEDEDEAPAPKKTAAPKKKGGAPMKSDRKDNEKK